jgi:hypothetical protein
VADFLQIAARGGTRRHNDDARIQARLEHHAKAGHTGLQYSISQAVKLSDFQTGLTFHSSHFIEEASNRHHYHAHSDY